MTYCKGLINLLLVVAVVFIDGVYSLRLANSISSNMVLQREPAKPNLWGWSNPNQQIYITIENQTPLTTTADQDGNWFISLPPQPASKYPISIVISDVSTQVKLTNVLFGDVYICSGQSNMEFSVNQAFNATAEIADSVNYPLLRLYSVARNQSVVPELDTSSRIPDQQWVVSSPQFVASNYQNWSWVSAVCYFYGRDLIRETGAEIPIGLIMTSFGGTTIEVWSSPQAMAQCRPQPPPDTAIAIQRLIEMDYILFDGIAHPKDASVLYNAMLYPLFNHAIAGFIWYQGEYNALDPNLYACRFPVFITDLRLRFVNNPNLAFYFVQLASYPLDSLGSFADMRGAQLRGLDAGNSYVVTAADLGDLTSPWGAIHPRNKQEIGRRLALQVAKNYYGITQFASTGPILQKIIFPPNVTVPGSIATIQVYYDSSLQSSYGLTFLPTADCWTCCNQLPFNATNSYFQILNAVSIDIDNSGHSLSINIQTPKRKGTLYFGGLEYANQDYVQCMLYNSAILPATPGNVPNAG